MRIKKIVAVIAVVLVCIVIIASTLFVSGQQGLVWLSVQSQSGKKFVAVRDKEMRSLLKDSAKEVMHQGKKVNAADYETTYGSLLFLVNWICPVQIKGAYPKREAKQNDDGQRSIVSDGYLVQIGFETYQISEEQYDLLLAPNITSLRETEYGEDEYAQTD
jgi:hypothetical protein